MQRGLQSGSRNHPMNEESIFEAALGKQTPAERSAYLEEACGGDRALRQQLEALLKIHDKVGNFLEQPALEQVALSETQAEPAAGPADDFLSFLEPSSRPDSLGRIGHYEVLEVLGRGGFGIVFRAFDEVLQRVVARQGAGAGDRRHVSGPQAVPARSPLVGPGSPRERGPDLRRRGATAAVPGHGVHPRRDACSSGSTAPARWTCRRSCGSAGRSPRGWPPPTRTG